MTDDPAPATASANFAPQRTGPSKPLPAAVLIGAGFALGLINTVRHQARGYRTPRRGVSKEDWDGAERYDRGVVGSWLNAAGGALDLAEKRVLEIGPGPDLGTGALLLGRGAKSYTAVDRFALAATVPKAFYKRFNVDLDVLDYQIGTFPALPELTGEFDVVVSNAALEHVKDVPQLFRRLAELVPPGGRMLHKVDASTHMRPLDRRDPLNIYRYGDRAYRLLSFPGAPNRLLSGDYLQAAEAAGFEAYVEPSEVLNSEYLAAARPGLARRFGGREDAACVHFFLHATRR